MGRWKQWTPLVARRSRRVRRVMYALFFDSDGIVARVSVPENCTLFFLPLLTTIRQSARGPGSEGSNYSMIMHPLTVLQWWSLIWRNFIFRSCHTHPIALTFLHVISGLTHISNLAYDDVNLRRTVLYSAWISRLEKCVQVSGEYFEGLN